MNYFSLRQRVPISELSDSIKAFIYRRATFDERNELCEQNVSYDERGWEFVQSSALCVPTREMFGLILAHALYALHVYAVMLFGRIVRTVLGRAYF